ncbi:MULTISPECIES: HAD-IIIC family phosphatase [Thermomonosporaceae]|uniref:HAD-IIIC family phosphatase n=1 Tax=Thermomonosporaceae TaxID=2012 RepID=UPI00255A7298|nr:MULTISPECIES: HAD-IIIC family phosphatase [Thermomonosporaceae]MDL4774174.1 HAD-IIIC family phosphatase [Actinomadura xylanilytica]
MTEPTAQLLGRLRTAVRDGEIPDPATRRGLLELTDSAAARSAGRILARLSADGPLRGLRVRIQAACTIGSFEHLLRANLVGAGFRPVIDKGGYGAFEMELATGAFLAADDTDEPDLLATLVDASFFLPADWSPAAPAALEQHVESRLKELRGLAVSATERTDATLVLHTVPLPAEVRDTFVSVSGRARLARLWHRINADLLDLAARHPQIAVIDLVGVLADAPVAARDARLHRFGDLPYTDGALLLLAGEVRRVAQARAGLSRKVLALDLDDTLWGGVLGEVGAHGVQLGGLYPGNAYQDLQRTARRLREQGVVLVLASKNDAEPVERALADHPEMVLRDEAFSVRAVNWSAKSDNLVKAAEALGLSVDSLVFMDDSGFERAQVGDALPQVAVVSAAGDPAHLPGALVRGGWFDVMALTDTDRARPDLYRTRAMRSDFSEGFGSSEEFLRALGIEMEIATATDFTTGRIAQLAARTNQFNMTGLRFDAAATTRMNDDAGHLVASVAVADRFGDEGIVGAVWVECGPEVWRVLNLVLSCRVLGRGVELATVGWLAERARSAGAARLEGRYVRSARNGVAADFWTRAGFTPGSGDDCFVRDLESATGIAPSWISLRERSTT